MLGSIAATIVVTLATVSTCRAQDTGELLLQAFNEQTDGELGRELLREVDKTFRAFERRGLTRTTDEIPKGAIVFYQTPYGRRGRTALSNGDGTVSLGPSFKESLPLDTIPGRLGWVEGPKKKLEKLEPCDRSDMKPLVDGGLASPCTASTTAPVATATPNGVDNTVGNTNPNNTNPNNTNPNNTNPNNTNPNNTNPNNTNPNNTNPNNNTAQNPAQQNPAQQNPANNSTGNGSNPSSGNNSNPVSQPSNPGSNTGNNPSSTYNPAGTNQVPPPVSNTASENSGPTNANAEDREILARIVKGETAPGCPKEGQIAVAAVVLNRVRSGAFGKSIKEVAHAPYQFSCYNANFRDKLYNGTVPQYAWDAADAALKGENPVPGCTYYFNPYFAQPTWQHSMTLVKTIGEGKQHRHDFYKPKNGKAKA